MSSAIRAEKLASTLTPTSRAWPGLTSAAPLHVLITGACGQIAYSLMFMILKGNVFGKQKIILHLLDIPIAAPAMQGILMELEDCAFPNLAGVVATTDVREACTGVNVAIMVGAFPRKQGMERKDLLSRNASIFVEQGKALNDYADPDVRILVVGNPANTNALILHKSAPSIPGRHIACLTRLDHNRCKSMLAKKLNVPSGNVRNVIIWGNHSSTQYPDASQGFVRDFPQPGVASSLSSLIDPTWAEEELVPAVQQRGSKVIEARKASSAASAANAICDCLHDWLAGTTPGDFVSMGVLSDGNPYGVAPGIIYSFPCVCVGGEAVIVSGLTLNQNTKHHLELSQSELLSERELAFSILGI